jgi:hypothetical protein
LTAAAPRPQRAAMGAAWRRRRREVERIQLRRSTGRGSTRTGSPATPSVQRANAVPGVRAPSARPARNSPCLSAGSPPVPRRNPCAVRHVRSAAPEGSAGFHATLLTVEFLANRQWASDFFALPPLVRGSPEPACSDGFRSTPTSDPVPRVPTGRLRVRLRSRWSVASDESNLLAPLTDAGGGSTESR